MLTIKSNSEEETKNREDNREMANEGLVIALNGELGPAKQFLLRVAEGLSVLETVSSLHT